MDTPTTITMRVVRATHKSDILKCLQLRYQIFAKELKWIPPNKKGIETDKYDDFTHHFLVEMNGIPIATNRIMLSRSDCPFFMESLWDISAFKQEYGTQLAEASRVCIATKYRSQKISFLLFKANWLFAKQHNIACYLANINPGEDSLNKKGVNAIGFRQTVERMGTVAFAKPKLHPKVKRLTIPVYLKLADIPAPIQAAFAANDPSFQV